MTGHHGLSRNRNRPQQDGQSVPGSVTRFAQPRHTGGKSARCNHPVIKPENREMPAATTITPSQRSSEALLFASIAILCDGASSNRG